jgi:hypothetical protein
MSSASSSPRSNGVPTDGKRIEVGSLGAVPAPRIVTSNGASAESEAKTGAFEVRREDRASGVQRASVAQAPPAPPREAGRVHVPVHAGKAAPAKQAPYVPGPRGGKQALKQEVLGEAELQATAASYFRTVAWDGKPVAPAAPRGLVREPLSFDADTPVRIAFASVAWTGTAPQPASPAQSKSSVESVLKSFRWE